MGTQDRWPPDDRWPSEGDSAVEDDLDRTFGHGDGVARRAGRGRRALFLAGGIVLVAVLIAVALLYIVTNVQNGIGGFFPRPQQAMQSFEQQSESFPGVAEVQPDDTAKTGFASYDVIADVTAERSVAGSARRDLVDDLAAQAASESRSGVTVYAMVSFGDGTVVGVSPDAARSAERLDLATELGAVQGVATVRCGWTTVQGTAIDDAVTAQRITLTATSGAAVPAVAAAVRPTVERVFPGATVDVRPPPG